MKTGPVTDRPCGAPALLGGELEPEANYIAARRAIQCSSHPGGQRLSDSGTILDGKYEIIERLGSGGMGEVYKARHIHLQELRVIMILRQDRAADPTAMQRFTQEARTATQIKHPNVAILYDFSQLPDGRFYMVWEHIQGEDVGHWLKSRGPLPLPLAVELGIQGLRGLEAVHAAGVIHRDLSPDNLMITRDPRGRYQAKIIDLGLAKSLANKADIEITQAGMFMGKLRYCARAGGALAQGESLDHRSDLYSFAAVLYEMVSGLPPFDSENQHGFVLKRLNEPPLHLEGRNPAVRVPRDLDAIVLKGLERERDRRYPDAVAFIQALAKFAERMRGAETQDMKVQAGVSTNPAGIPKLSPTATKPMMATTAPTVPGARAAAQAIERPAARELSREERIDILAQIDRVAKRADAPASAATPARKPEAAGATPMQRAGAAVVAGRFDEAQRIIAEIRASGENPRGLDDLVRRLAQSEQAAELAPKIREAEQMLERYLHDHKQSLAALALDALLELAPEHPRRAELEGRVARINEDVARRKRADDALGAGREAMVRGDFRAARQKLEAIQANDAEASSGPNSRPSSRNRRPRRPRAGTASSTSALSRTSCRCRAIRRPKKSSRPYRSSRSPKSPSISTRPNSTRPRRGRRKPPPRKASSAATARKSNAETGLGPARSRKSSNAPTRKARARPRCSPRSRTPRKTSASSRPSNTASSKSTPSSSKNAPPTPSWRSRSCSAWIPRTSTNGGWSGRSRRSGRHRRSGGRATSVEYSRLVLIQGARTMLRPQQALAALVLFSSSKLLAQGQPACLPGTSATFAATGTVQSYPIPLNTTKLLIDAAGASGGLSGSLPKQRSGPGGRGFRVVAEVAAPAAGALAVLVGSPGGSGGVAVFAALGGGGGGGGSFVYTTDSTPVSSSPRGRRRRP